jgi:hypothetical protein
MGFWGALGKGLGIAGGALAAPFTGGASLIPTIMGAAGAGLGAISEGKAKNRGEKFGGQLDLERALLEREMGNMRSGGDAWRRLQAAQRTKSPGARPQLSPYSVAPRQATGAELSGADAMTREVMARLQRGPMEAQVDPDLLDSGWFERIAGYASPVLGPYSRLGQNPPIQNRAQSMASSNYLQQAPRV